MNILFLTTGRMDSIEQHAIYPDLLRCFRDNGHNVYTVSSYEKRTGKNTALVEDHGAHMLHVKIGNLTRNNTIEKGISTVMIENQYKFAIIKYLSNVKFDLVMYSTPPITLVKVIEYIKKRDNCKSYLLLKDIFPQNAVDLGMMKKTGLKGILYKYFRVMEKELYAISDYIGCMSQANVDYVIKHNPEINSENVEVCPNCIDVSDTSISVENRIEIRNKYAIPLDKQVFVYGGNLGKPQGIPFLIECLKKVENHKNAYFLIVGGGTEYGKLEAYINDSKPQNIRLMQSLPKNDYDAMVGACDVGMIFLDYRFTIPNFPSRLLAYMQAKLPVLAVTDQNTDIGKIIVEGEFGWWCESNDANEFRKIVEEITNDNLRDKGIKGFEYLLKHYEVSDCVKQIESRVG
ncbi:MAG: glycosyltransferase family 4 protein [Saccharofermentans sp.]|nr:glycosyltransferase family 4 protein [Saccharofermentans sp.]